MAEKDEGTPKKSQGAPRAGERRSSRRVRILAEVQNLADVESLAEILGGKNASGGGSDVRSPIADPTSGSGAFLKAGRQSLLHFGINGVLSAADLRTRIPLLDFGPHVDVKDGKLEEAIREAYETVGEQLTGEQIADIARQIADARLSEGLAQTNLRQSSGIDDDNIITVLTDEHGNLVPPLGEASFPFFTITIPHLIRQRLLPSVGLIVMACLYLWLRPGADLLLGVLALAIGVLLNVDALAIWLRYRATAYGDDLLEVGEVARYVAEHLGPDGSGGGQGRELPLYPHELEEKVRSRASSMGHVPQGVRA